MEERVEEDGESKENPGEARVVMAVVKRLIDDHGVRVEDIGVITPYNGQVAVLRELRAQHESMHALEVSTVDGFQGREKEAIVISAVRSNTNGEVGFLSDSRRMNVAVTRARKHCCLICDTDTVRGDAFLANLVEYFETRGDIASAAEYVDV
jgi:superfamily I DNA and/or RNA helicase